MKLRIRPSATRRQIDIGWLKGSHSFNNEQNRFEPLVVLNEDQIAPMHGFPLHPHKNFEIFTYMLAGELTHTDSMGTQELCKKGSVQFVSAGKGIEHGEFNSSKKEFVKALQVWVTPRNFNTTPIYQIKKFNDEDKMNKLNPFIVPKELANETLIGIDQDFYGYASILQRGKSVVHSVVPNRQVFIHLPAMGDVSLQVKSGNDSLELKGGDGIYVYANGAQDEELIIEAIE